MQASRIYMQEFRARAERAYRQRFGRQALLTDAAHEAYRVATDRLTAEFGWDDEKALVVMRGLNSGVQGWLALGAVDLDSLERELERREAELENGFGSETS
jgi:hypothetical protein